MKNNHPTPRRAGLALLATLLSFALAGGGTAFAWDVYDSWDSRCEECHSEAADFSEKYLWVVDDKLQGRHHIDDMHLFMRNHYVPKHEIEVMTAMLKEHANKMARYEAECSECHQSAKDFVRESISTWGDGPTGVETGKPIAEYLVTHRDLGEENAAFYVRLIERVLDQIKQKPERVKKAG